MSAVPTRPSPAVRVKTKKKNSTARSRDRVPPAGAPKKPLDEATGSSLQLGPLPDFVGYPLRRAQIAVFDDFMRTMEQVGLRPGQFSTLIVIDCNPGSKQSDVAAALGIQGTNFVAMINQLEGRGLVERRALDRRSYGLHLTAAGQKLLARGIALQSAQEKTFDDLLGAGGRQVLLGMLARLTAGLEARNGRRG